MASIMTTEASSDIALQPIVRSQATQQQRLSANNSSFNLDSPDFLPQPSTTVHNVQRWNNPKVNIYRTLATLWAFTLMGANDAAYGAIIPYLEEYYDLTYVVVSLVFLSPLAGYATSAVLNNTVHVHFGQRGVAIIGPLCHLAAYVGIALHPPYPVLVVVFILAGFGNGLEDAAWNAWVGNMANSNEVLGFLHGFYGVGALLSPLVATALITRAGWPWYAYYYILLGGAAIELATSLAAFWKASGTAYRDENPRTAAVKESRLKESLSSRVTWVVAIFLLGYVGVEVALGGWIVTFMIRERSGSAFASGMVATGFWTGIASGRFVLGFVTPKLGEKLAVVIYIVLAIVAQIIFWLVPQFHVSAVAVSCQGFFLGPLFPAAIVAATKILPAYLHVSAIGFAAAFGGGGAAILPFGIGALAQAKGVQILQPIILAILALLLLLWLCLPTLEKKTTDESRRAEQDLSRQWVNIDVDLVELGRRTIQRSGGSLPQRHVGAAIKHRLQEQREKRAEERHIRDQIRNIRRETPAFAVLDGVDPASQLPPPYRNVRTRMSN